MNDKEIQVIDFAYLRMCAEHDYIYETGKAKLLLNYITNLQQENEKYKEVIDKIDKKINDFIKCCKAEKIESGSDFLHHSYWNMFESFNKQIKEILKEVKK